MDLQEQLKNLFPDHVLSDDSVSREQEDTSLFIQKEPLICKYEKRNGKPTTLIEGYEGCSDTDFKTLSKMLKTKLSVGGSVKNGQIILQGDYRNQIMDFLKNLGFKVKRVGG